MGAVGPKRGRNPLSIAQIAHFLPRRGKLNFRGTKAAAERILAEKIKESEIEKDKLARPGPGATEPQALPAYTLGEWLQTYFDEWCMGLRPTTLKGYRSAIRANVPQSVLDIPLTMLRPRHLQPVFNRMLEAGRAVSTVRGTRARGP